MSFYITIFTIFFLLSLIEALNKKSYFVKVTYVGICLFLFILSFLRWETGTDWINYYNYFKYIFDLPYELDIFEIGFRTLNYSIRYLTDEYSVMLFTLGGILFFFQSLAIKKLSPFPILSLTFLYASQLGNILFVRQWIAIAILFYSITYIQKNKFIPFIALVLIASSIHRSALIFIISWWIFKINISTKKILLSLCLTIFLSYIIESFLFSFLGSIGMRVIQARLSIYMDDSYNSGLKENINFTLVLIKGFINRAFILFISLYIYIKNSENKILRGYINLYWLGCILFFSLISISPALARLAYYFDFIQVILISYIMLFSFRTITNRIIALIILGIYMLFRLNQFLNGPYSEELIPYKFVNFF